MTLSEKFKRLKEIKELEDKLQIEKATIEQDMLEEIIRYSEAISLEKDCPNAYYFTEKETGEQFKVMCYVDVDRKGIGDTEWESLGF